uniref:Ribosomal protein L32 n=1 Tax=Neogoniolithon spectabile TaxID=231755 RepID=A0A3G3MH26_9FLOR|nr:ribosomal protein L32 [Neogoniolithon spectabile]AYR06148.1 ribosomal protein L32 [Neogoniolithon spectabile]
MYPRKKTSKSKIRSRKAVWKRKAYIMSLKALSLAKSNCTNTSNSYRSTDNLFRADI